MYSLILIFIFLLGIIVGSFLNVVIYRLNTGRKATKGRSICMTCNHNLRWYELIPIFSFLIQSGKCRRCVSNISHQYPVVEFITGLIFVFVALKFLPVFYASVYLYIILSILFFSIFSLFIVMTVYDLRHKIIPNKLVYAFIVLSFVSIFINFYPIGNMFILPTWVALLSGPVIALPFVLIWVLSKGRLMGLGDGKLMLGIGWMLGLSSGLFAVILAFWIGTVFSIILMLLSKGKVSMKTEIPFAPFLIISTLATFFFDLNFFTLVKLFSF